MSEVVTRGVELLDEQIEAARAGVAVTHARLEEQRDELRRLERARAAALGESSPRDAATQAGPRLIAAVRGVLQEASQPVRAADVARQVERNSGSVAYALRALVDSGEAVAIGDGRSKRYTVPQGRRRAVV